ncbi:hypothetical protein [Gracilibacillus timonensis]|uniref:hypothetical protein n=1 Tax=Gracilibacillus timonensis TaxID=1816696 RepID=UPI000826B8C9|nr:hypothetical protein [Gracilibacillus timonensis]
MAVKRSLLLWLSMIILTSGCASEQRTVQLENKDFADLLYVQKIEKSVASEQQTKIVTDLEEIENVLTELDGMETENIDREELMKKLEQEDNYYVFGFFDDAEMGSTSKGNYAFQIFADGTVLFSYDEPNSPGQPLKAVEKHPDLIETYRALLDMNF